MKPSDPSVLTEKQFSDFGEIITSHLGIKMPLAKKTMLQGRLFRRVRELKMETISNYHLWFFSHPGAMDAELQQLINLATTNKTDFFREPSHFDFLSHTVIPEWKKSSFPHFALWCAGCSTGEEPYTLAMTLSEAQSPAPFEFRILATDVSTRALRKARQAIYAEPLVAAIPPTLRSKYLLRSKAPSKRTYRIAPEIREKIRFGTLNFLADSYRIPAPINAIFFRNVMIYFDRENQQKIVAKMCDKLAPGGYLFIGHSESLNGLNLPLATVCPAVYRRI